MDCVFSKALVRVNIFKDASYYSLLPFQVIQVVTCAHLQNSTSLRRKLGKPLILSGVRSCPVAVAVAVPIPAPSMKPAVQDHRQTVQYINPSDWQHLAQDPRVESRESTWRDTVHSVRIAGASVNDTVRSLGASSSSVINVSNPNH